MSAWRGRCHCGAIGFEYSTAKPVGGWPVRACQCSFCLKHAGVYTSDPAGSLRFTHADPTQVTNYRFGHQTADFIFCGRCGGFLGALMEEHGQRYFVHNVHVLDPLPAGLPSAQAMAYEGESTGERVSRRSMRWTPVIN